MAAKIINPVGSPAGQQEINKDIERNLDGKEDALPEGATEGQVLGAGEGNGAREWITLSAANVAATAPSGLTGDDVQELLNAIGVALAARQPLDSDLTAIAALTTTSFGRGLLELANAGALRTAAALGSLATLSSINNGNWSGTALAVANGGTGSTSAANARTALGVPAAASGTHTGTTNMANVNASGNVTINGNLQAGELELTSATVVASVAAATHRIAIVAGGTTYRLLATT